MVSFNFLFLLSATVLATAAAPAAATAPKKFHIRVLDPDSSLHLTNYYLSTFHTGAGLADSVFTSNKSIAAVGFLNGTNLQIDQPGNQFPFSLDVTIGDTNYARWEPTSVAAGYGSGNFVNNGPEGIQIGGAGEEEFGGWVVCEWFHTAYGVANLPQLFVGIKGFDGNPGAGGPQNLPATCANVLLFPEWI